MCFCNLQMKRISVEYCVFLLRLQQIIAHSDIEQHKFIMLQLCWSEVWQSSHLAKIKVQDYVFFWML